MNTFSEEYHLCFPLLLWQHIYKVCHLCIFEFTLKVLRGHGSTGAIDYIHSVVQPSPLPISDTFSSPQQKLCNHHYAMAPHSPLSPNSWETASLFSVSVNHQLQRLHISRIIQYLFFCVWCTSLRTMFSRLIHIVAGQNSIPFYG